ncbi:hypothetical protein AB395_0000475 [Sinorhizobium fredii CCBAU 45436]|nr:hypothetical protein AB395_0000475 [Sinorhizobium fredii CCBAU 45436]
MMLAELASDRRGPDRTPFVDPLTGLGNAQQLRHRVCELAAERASDPAPFTIGLANLDGFKPINDLFGPEAGDRILRQVAQRLRACVPEGATVMRTADDEFALVLPLVFERKSAEKLGQMLKEILSAPFDLGDRTVRLSASFGFAVYPFAGAEFEDLLKSADTALYRSKRRGRGQITVYSQEIAQEMKRATQLEQALRNAIIAEEIDVHFQPIVDLRSDGVVGFEALARWCDPEFGYVSPSVFVPLAEERGFIEALAEMLLRKAAQTALAWPKELFLSFNLSSAQLMDPATSGRLLAIVNQVGLDPRRLELEITETAVMADATWPRRSSPNCERPACACLSTISAPGNRASAGCVISPSTRSRSTAPSSRGFQPIGPPNISSGRSYRCARAWNSRSSPRASRTSPKC